MASPLASSRINDHRSRHSATSGAPEEMFSPTSAAALTLTALSNLHNFGAAAPHDTENRGSSDSLTGTRLFNGSNVLAIKSRKTERSDVSGSSNDATQTQTLTPSVGNSCIVPPANGSISWGYSQVHPLENVSSFAFLAG